MHNNYYFLRQLSASLDKILTGTVISECHSQSKDELIIRFETHTRPFFIKASLVPAFSCLQFPEEFNRARKNSVDLFPQLIGLHVKSIRQFENERSFALMLTDNFTLLFKLHGNRSNIVLFQNDQPVQLFKNDIPADASISLENLDCKIDWSHDAFIANQGKLDKLYFTFGKVVWNYLETLNFEQKPIGEKWSILHDVLKSLEVPVYYVSEIGNGLHLSLLAFGKIRKTFNDPVEAINVFYTVHSREITFIREQNAVVSSLRDRLKSGHNYYEKTLNKLNEIDTTYDYRKWADNIMANLHVLRSGSEKAVVPDVYNNNVPVEIRLKKDLTPQKNAELYYRKAKNQHLEIHRLQSALQMKKAEIAALESSIAQVAAAHDLKALRAVANTLGLIDAPKKGATEPVPYHEMTFHGFRIWVGRNARANDQLTFKFAYKEDLWLHAKDVAGSHVVIKHQAGKNFPKEVIERAAQVAAYHSKRKTDSLCPVTVTPRKFVRKRKGDQPGEVVVEREQVILVTPQGMDKAVES